MPSILSLFFQPSYRDAERGFFFHVFSSSLVFSSSHTGRPTLNQISMLSLAIFLSYIAKVMIKNVLMGSFIGLLATLIRFRLPDQAHVVAKYPLNYHTHTFGLFMDGAA
ncbi:hypothetical protein MKW98_006767 [Papaver atlanticum]|uniref:Uncharacterized protein n=1 Tax=Papaver atlanticum TaxID=357466 RepID=A0AAD4T2P3_9MAGN|nr:hypothetical protein MKW98_006767 [Papaver atlanticum]